jgi:hypothetical protein
MHVAGEVALRKLEFALHRRTTLREDIWKRNPDHCLARGLIRAIRLKGGMQSPAMFGGTRKLVQLLL